MRNSNYYTSGLQIIENDNRVVMLSCCVRHTMSENYSGDELSLFIYIPTMDDQDMRDKDTQANTADKNAEGAEETAGAAHKSAADAHEQKAEEYK